MFRDNNESNVIDSIQAWIQNGLSTDGIPFIHRLGELNFYQLEQISSNFALLCLLIYLVFKLDMTKKNLDKINEEIIKVQNNQLKCNTSSRSSIFDELGLSK